MALHLYLSRSWSSRCLYGYYIRKRYNMLVVLHLLVARVHFPVLGSPFTCQRNNPLKSISIVCMCVGVNQELLLALQLPFWQTYRTNFRTTRTKPMRTHTETCAKYSYSMSLTRPRRQEEHTDFSFQLYLIYVCIFNSTYLYTIHVYGSSHFSFQNEIVDNATSGLKYTTYMTA